MSSVSSGLAAAVALLALLAGCAKDAPQDYLDPSGPIAKEADHLFKKIVFFAVIPVLVVIEACWSSRWSASGTGRTVRGRSRRSAAPSCVISWRRPWS